MAAPAPTPFDTLSAARELEDAGLERRHAEAIAGTVRKATAADREALATKGDLAELRAATKADLEKAIAGLRGDMLKTAISIAVGVVVANATLTAVLVFGALRLLQP